jgi:PhnB protein
MAKVNPIPPGYYTATPYLVLDRCAEAIAFYKRAFGAEEIGRMPGPDGKRVMHAEIRIGDSIIFLADEFPQAGCSSPKSLGGTTTGIHLFVTDVDAAFGCALAPGATVIMPPMNMFWGDRFGKLSDPFGHQWSIATHVEDVPPQEMGKRAAEAFKNGCKPD